MAHMGYLQPRLGSGIPYTVPRGTYRTADGIWVAISSSADSVASRGARFARAHRRSALFDLPGAQQATASNWSVLWPHWVGAAAVRGSHARVPSWSTPPSPWSSIWRTSSRTSTTPRATSITEVDGITMQNVVARLSKTPGQLKHALARPSAPIPTKSWKSLAKQGE